MNGLIVYLLVLILAALLWGSPGVWVVLALTALMYVVVFVIAVNRRL